MKFNFHVLKFQAESVVFKMLDEVLQLIIGSVIQRHLVDVVLNVNVELVFPNDVILFHVLDFVETPFNMLESTKLFKDHSFISVGFEFNLISGVIVDHFVVLFNIFDIYCGSASELLSCSIFKFTKLNNGIFNRLGEKKKVIFSVS